MAIMIRKEALKGIMRERGFRSNAQLAQTAGISIPHFSHVINTGDCSLKTVNKICSALRCQPGDFLMWTPDGELAQGAPVA